MYPYILYVNNSHTYILYINYSHRNTKMCLDCKQGRRVEGKNIQCVQELKKNTSGFFLFLEGQVWARILNQP